MIKVSVDEQLLQCQPWVYKPLFYILFGLGMNYRGIDSLGFSDSFQRLCVAYF